MTVSAFTALLGVWLAAICSPGPDLLFVTRVATRSRARGLAAAGGIVSGIVAWLVLALAGLGALLTGAPWLLSALQIVGGTYLLWLGQSALRAGVRQLRAQPRDTSPYDIAHPSAQPPPAEARSENAGPKDAGQNLTGAFFQGLLTNLSNPKVVIFFGAVFANFVTPGMNLASHLLIVAVLAVAAMIWFGGVAWGLGSPRFANELDRSGPWIDAVSGIIFMALAIAVIVEGATSL